MIATLKNLLQNDNSGLAELPGVTNFREEKGREA